MCKAQRFLLLLGNISLVAQSLIAKSREKFKVPYVNASSSSVKLPEDSFLALI